MVGIRNDWHEAIISDDDRRRYPIYLDGQLSLSRRTNYKCRFLLTRHANASERDSVWLSCPDVACAWKYSSNYLIRTHQFLSFILISDMSPPTSTISTVPAAGTGRLQRVCACVPSRTSVASIAKESVRLFSYLICRLNSRCALSTRTRAINQVCIVFFLNWLHSWHSLCAYQSCWFNYRYTHNTLPDGNASATSTFHFSTRWQWS